MTERRTRARLTALLAIVTVLAASCARAAEGGTTATTPTTEEDPREEPVDVAALVSSAVVVEGIACGRSSIGSGIVTEDGILTSAHVVAGVEDLTVRVEGGEPMPAIVLALDPRTDLAVLNAEGLDAQPLGFALPEGGSAAVALVGGSGEVEALDVTIERTINITIGDIYGDGDHQRRGMELGADISPGDSGGAVVDAAGDVVGLIFSSSRRNAEVSYAVSSAEFGAVVASVDGSPVDVGPCRR